jgi:hypothetical protein
MHITNTISGLKLGNIDMTTTNLNDEERDRERPRARAPYPGAFPSPPSSSTKYLQTSRWPLYAAICNALAPSTLKEKIADRSPFPLVRLFTIPFPKETSSCITEMNSQTNKIENTMKQENLFVMHKNLMRSTEPI